ncbi:MAG: hypothetical protein RQ751_09245 [Longimicrobiales bacterium]|nr:hypothetical protein [Longimicrobiales bacterium]
MIHLRVQVAAAPDRARSGSCGGKLPGRRGVRGTYRYVSAQGLVIGGSVRTGARTVRGAPGATHDLTPRRMVEALERPARIGVPAAHQLDQVDV